MTTLNNNAAPTVDFSNNPFTLVLKAISFAARAHKGQTRKDGQTPYASHCYRVATIVQHQFQISDPEVITAAVLHDTIEDTTTDYDDLIETFGPNVANWVAALTKNSRLPFEQRETEYRNVLAQSPWQVKVCKLADVLDNFFDCASFDPHRQAQTHKKLRRYLAILEDPLDARVDEPWRIVKAHIDCVPNQSNPS